MAEIIMPKMGDAMTEGKVVRWYKKQGDSVKKGEPVLEIETDKVNLDLEAEEDGVISEIVVEEGATAEVGAALAIIGGEGAAEKPKKSQAKKSEEAPAKKESEEEAESPEEPEFEDEDESEAEEEEDKEAEPEGETEEKPSKAAKGKEPASKKPQAETVAKAPSDGETPKRDVSEPPSSPSTKSATPAKTGGDTRHVRSSPLARRMASHLGVDLGNLKGSGPSGRVIASDVKRAAEVGGAPASRAAKEEKAKPALPPLQDLQDATIPLSAMRKTIARRLGESLGPIPHFFLTIEADVTELQRLREQISEISGVKVSVNDFVIRATALALRHHPNVNSSFTETAIQQHGAVHVGVAVATPEGLITPVIRNADGKSVAEIAGEVRELAGRARNRKLRPDEYQGSTITISNLGMFGIEEFTAVINPPNVAILAIGAAMEKPVVIDRKIRIRERMKVTMSCDHRVVDGAAGAEYLRTLKVYLEQPLRLVL